MFSIIGFIISILVGLFLTICGGILFISTSSISHSMSDKISALFIFLLGSTIVYLSIYYMPFNISMNLT